MAMIRRRIYNPAHLTPEELKESFVAREDTLAELLRVIREQAAGRPCQHMMLIGPRGMGKTTLGLRLLYAIEDDSDLRERWQPVAFHEESYGVVNLADFWIHALRHLTRATGESRWEARAEALTKDEGDLERAAAYALAELTDFNRESGKRLILFVENFDSIIGQIHDERDIHSLRATLIERPKILLLGSANAYFESIGGYGEPLYEFFRVFKLEGIGQEETRRILEAVAGSGGRPEVSESLNMEQGRLETIRRLTGGNPRLLTLACRLLIESPLSSAVEDLERLIDEQTPYFKARIEDLPGQARKVFHCLSKGWKPLLAREVATAANLSSSHASAQLKQLLEKGYTREIRLPGAKRTRYEVSDRFYNIYYLLRFSPSGRARLERLVDFLCDLYGPSGMRSMYPTALAALRDASAHLREAGDLLSVLAGRVALDQGFEGRKDWLSGALTLAVKFDGPNSATLQEISRALDDSNRTGSSRLDECLKRARELLVDERLVEAEAACREALAIQPNNARAWWYLGCVLTLDEHSEDAIEVLEQALELSNSNDSQRASEVHLGILAVKAFALCNLRRFDAVSRTIEIILDSLDSTNDDDELCHIRVVVSLLDGTAMKKMDRHDDAISAWSRVTELVHGDAPAESRLVAAVVTNQKGSTLAMLGHHDAAASAWKQAIDYVRSEDTVEMRGVAVSALFSLGDELSDRSRYEDAVGFFDQISEYVRLQDPAELRHLAINAAGISSFIRIELGQLEDITSLCKYVEDYTHEDDALEIRRMTAETLSHGARTLNSLGRHDHAEAASRVAKGLDDGLHESWIVLADSILSQGDDTRLSEAEECARHATKLSPHDPSALLTLSHALARRGNWTEAMNELERSVRIGSRGFRQQERQSLTEAFIRFVAAGYGPRARQIMDEAGLAELMEPLWHAVRAEVGEELEPLPSEVMDVVRAIRQRISSG